MSSIFITIDCCCCLLLLLLWQPIFNHSYILAIGNLLWKYHCIFNDGHLLHFTTYTFWNFRLYHRLVSMSMFMLPQSFCPVSGSAQVLSIHTIFTTICGNQKRGSESERENPSRLFSLFVSVREQVGGGSDWSKRCITLSILSGVPSVMRTQKGKSVLR